MSEDNRRMSKRKRNEVSAFESSVAQRDAGRQRHDLDPAPSNLENEKTPDKNGDNQARKRNLRGRCQSSSMIRPSSANYKTMNDDENNEAHQHPRKRTEIKRTPVDHPGRPSSTRRKDAQDDSEVGQLVGEETMSAKSWKLEELDSNESDGESISDAVPQGFNHTTKKRSAARKARVGTRSVRTQVNSSNPCTDPPSQQLSATRSRTRSARAMSGAATAARKFQQILRQDTIKASDQMPEHIHIDYPGKNWRDKSQPPSEHVALQPGSLGAWICKKSHARGQYIMASVRDSCAGCGDTRMREQAERMPWDLEPQVGYIINNEKEDLQYFPKVDYDAKIKATSRLEGLHINAQAARMRVFLKRMYPTAAEDELRQYWSRPFEWTDKGRQKARELMEEVLEDVKTGSWEDDLEGKKGRSRAKPSRVAKSSSRRPVSAQAQAETIEEFEETSDLDNSGSSLEESEPDQDTRADADQGLLHEVPNREPPSITDAEGAEVQRTPLVTPYVDRDEDRLQLVQEEPGARDLAASYSVDVAVEDEGFYILVFGVLEGIEAMQQANLREYIARFCALPVWGTMERVPNDELFRHLVGFLSWEIRVEENPRLAMPFSQRMVDEVCGLRKEFWPDYRELLHALHEASAVYKRKLRRNPNAEI